MTEEINKDVLDKDNNSVSVENNMVEEKLTSSKNNDEVIDLGAVIRKLWKGRKLYYIVLPIVFVLSCLHILTVPRTYSTSIELAPELDQPSMGGSLSSIALSFGFDLSDLQSSDAITPLLYPDLMDDNKDEHCRDDDNRYVGGFHSHDDCHSRKYPIIYNKV